MEILPRHERLIKKQMASYNSITQNKITMRLWIEKLLDLGDTELEKQRHLLHTGLMVKK